MFRLYKKQKLCSRKAIDSLFVGTDGVEAALVYPLRAVWRRNDGRRSDAPIQFLISIPKKRLRHAVDRVAMRRRIREAFRLHHGAYPVEGRVDVAFVYVAKELKSYARVEAAMTRLLERISSHPSEP